MCSTTLCIHHVRQSCSQLFPRCQSRGCHYQHWKFFPSPSHACDGTASVVPSPDHCPAPMGEHPQQCALASIHIPNYCNPKRVLCVCVCVFEAMKTAPYPPYTLPILSLASSILSSSSLPLSQPLQSFPPLLFSTFLIPPSPSLPLFLTSFLTSLPESHLPPPSSSPDTQPCTRLPPAFLSAPSCLLHRRQPGSARWPGRHGVPPVLDH